MAKAVEIPVYLFTGFLEGGKTRFIRETLEDKKFNVWVPFLERFIYLQRENIPAGNCKTHR